MSGGTAVFECFIVARLQVKEAVLDIVDCKTATVTAIGRDFAIFARLYFVLSRVARHCGRANEAARSQAELSPRS